jgi:DNA-binding transcriptional ArsR family regulator
LRFLHFFLADTADRFFFFFFLHFFFAGAEVGSKQAVSKHLGVLDRAGLVESRRKGREVRYSVRTERLDAATRSMAELAADWDKRLQTIKRVAEAR